MCEELGRSRTGPEATNCSAPDTGNMEVLARYGSGAQKERWLGPLLRGEVRSAFLMTEPGVASCDGRNLGLRMERVGAEWVLNGEVSCFFFLFFFVVGGECLFWVLVSREVSGFC